MLPAPGQHIQRLYHARSNFTIADMELLHLLTSAGGCSPGTVRSIYIVFVSSDVSVPQGPRVSACVTNPGCAPLGSRLRDSIPPDYTFQLRIYMGLVQPLTSADGCAICL